MATTRVFNDRYEISQHVARGGMAEVYLARDLLLDRPVALKVLFQEFAYDRTFVERFRREARAAAGLNHPNIVSIYDWGQEGDTYFIVMEYVEGRTLRDIIRGDGPLLSRRAAEIGADIAAALGFAHRHGVIHRDVKPGNVIITPHGQIKVTDFGIARAGDPEESLTQTGAVMGTATYFSPEQAQGGPVDPRSDVYSLGVVLYEMVTGRPPFGGDNPVAIAYQHVRETPVAPREVNPDVSAPFEAVVLKTLAKNPANRYPSAEDLRADLLRFVEGRPVAAEPVLTPPTLDDDASSAIGATRVQQAYADGTRVLPAPGAATGVGPAATGVPGRAGRPKPRTGAYAVLLVVLLAALGVLLFFLGRELGVFKNGTSGGSPVTEQSVIGLSLSDATRQLTSQGLKVTSHEAASDQAAGQVTAQDPPSGTQVHRGDTVTLTVSSGPAPISLPDVRGKTLADAQVALSGFNVVPRTTPSDQPKDQVLDQTPAAGTQAKKGDTVTLTVSGGPAQVTVPDVSGQDPVNAANQLGSAGLRVGRQVSEPSDTVGKGKVTRTDPPAGAQVAKDSTVTIYVSSGPATGTVPDVIGQTQSDATNTLMAAGFHVRVVTMTVTDPIDDGRVIDENPKGNTTAPQGSTVTITVGKLGGP